MNHKVLLADDSLTIQKVIKITLANQPYDITDCSGEDELFAKLPVVQPKLVFLDFNLSDKFTGYELTAKIKSLLPSAKILLLLGTFDTIDDDAMIKAGASDKIVKPFDSNKFIAICKQLISTFSEGNIEYPSAKPVAPEEGEDVDQQWTVNHSTGQSFKRQQPEIKKAESSLNLLDKEVSDWGMSIPGVIGGEASEIKIDLPPVIGSIETSASASKDTNRYPESDDLDYPTVEEITAPNVFEEKSSAKAQSKLISIETFNNDALELEGVQDAYKKEESDVNSIEAQIRDEVEENLWQVDEFEDLKNEVAAKIEEVKTSFQPSRNAFDESLFKSIDEEAPAVKAEAVSMDMKDIDALVKKHVHEYMDQMFKQNVEKISWEVIPDLAENLIRQELSKIATKILNDQN